MIPVRAKEEICEIRAAHCTISDKPVFLGQIREIAQKFNCRIICFNAEMLAGRRHAEAAVRCAARSFGSGGRNISNTPEMEALLYAAGSRQCHIAASFGPHAGDNHLWICCYPVHQGIWSALASLVHFPQDDSPWERIDETRRKTLMHYFGITQEECDALDAGHTLVDMVVERVVLLQILR